jgi:hypothetical protein
MSPVSPETQQAFAALHSRWRNQPDDPALAAELAELARVGHAGAAFALAVIAFEGLGGEGHGRPRDAAAAFAWALRAAHGGFAAAQAMAGDFYLHAEPEHGAGIRLAERALGWHERAARAGHADAALAASDSRRMGRGCERDFAAAYHHFCVHLAVSPAPPELVRLLGPSLRTDLSEDAVARIEADAALAAEGLPRPDADLEVYWRTQALAHDLPV